MTVRTMLILAPVGVLAVLGYWALKGMGWL